MIGLVLQLAFKLVFALVRLAAFIIALGIRLLVKLVRSIAVAIRSHNGTDGFTPRAAAAQTTSQTAETFDSADVGGRFTQPYGSARNPGNAPMSRRLPIPLRPKPWLHPLA